MADAPHSPNVARPLGWGIVGFGWVARDYGVPGILASGDRFAAAFDGDPKACRAIRCAGVRAYATLDALLSDAQVDAVYVATPNHAHRAIVEAVAAAGKPVLCEKPMAATLADAEAMVECILRTGVPYGTAFDQRHHPAHAAMRDALGAGKIGTVTAVRIAYGCWLPPAWAPLPGHDNWRADPLRAGGGALMDLAPHGLDLVQFLLGEPIIEVAAMIQKRVQDYAVDDGALLIGRTTSGVLVQLHVAYNCPDALPRRRLEVLGSRGQLVAENTMGQTAGGRVIHTDHQGTRGDLAVEDAATPPFARQMKAFAQVVRTGVSGDFDIRRDLHTMQLLHRAYAEAR